MKQKDTDAPVYATPFNWEEMVINSKIPVLVDFYAAWCGPCKMMNPYLETLASDFAGKARIVKVDIDKYPFIANDWSIMSIPTFILFKGGSVVQKWQGMVSPKTLEAALNSSLI